MRSSRRLKIILGIFGVLTFVVLITTARELINELLIRPFLVFLSTVLGFLAIFNQRIVWISFLVIFSVFVLASLLPFKRRRRERRVFPSPPPSRLRLWRRYLNDFSKGNYLKWRFGQRMSFLLLRTIALKNNLHDTNLMYNIDRTKQYLPEYLYDYVAATNQPYIKAGRPTLMNTTSSLERNILDSVTPEVVVSYLERELLIAPTQDPGGNYD